MKISRFEMPLKFLIPVTMVDIVVIAEAEVTTGEVDVMLKQKEPELVVWLYQLSELVEEEKALDIILNLYYLDWEVQMVVSDYAHLLKFYSQTME